MTRAHTLASWCAALATVLSGISVSNAQDIKGSIKYTSEAPTIDGVGDDAVWASATPLADFFNAGGDAAENDEDISAEWRALWDEDNLYFWIDVKDSVLFTEDTNEWKDDSVELYIDASALGKSDDPLMDYRPVGPIFGPPDEGDPVPVYQLTFIAGQAEIYNGVNHRSWVLNHPGLELGDAERWEHQGASIKTDDTGYTLEIAFPWASLSESEAIDIINRGFLGLGIAINDNDLGGDRQTQLMWATELGDLWNNPTSFPDVELLFPEIPGPDIAVAKSLKLGVLSAAEPTFMRTIPVTNFGSDAPLTISNVTVSGPDKDLVTVETIPNSVDPRGTANIEFNLTPGRTGEFSFTIDIESNDVDTDDQTRSVAVSATVFNFAGPAAHFSLDEPAGSAELLDITGFGNHGTYTDAVLGAEALATGTAATFDGSAYASFNSATLAPESFSVALWLNADALAATQLLIGQGDPAFALMLSDGKPAWFSNTEPEFTADSTPFETGTTHHVAATYDATGDTPTVTLYADGAVIATETDASEIQLLEDTWVIGSFSSQLGFTGRLDDVQIYDRVLSAEEVAGIYATPGLGGIPGSIDAGIDVSGLADITSPADAIVVVSGTNDDDADAGEPPAAESVENAVNDQAQKYLNFLDLGSGFVVTPASGLTTVSAIRLYTANDSPARDPASYRLEGGASPDGPFTLISEGLLDLPDDRNGTGAEVLDPETSANQVVTFLNGAPYSSYRLTFPALKDAGNDNSMQIAEVELLGAPYEIPTPAIAYDFNEGSGTVIGNGGELVNAHAGAWVASGGPDGSGYLNFTQDGANGAESQHILTGVTASEIPVSGDVDYTMMAWARFDEWTPPGVNNDDRMIFGQLDGNVLHNGLRGDQYHMGHWGNDTTGGTVEIGEWHHVTWHFQEGVQRILVDGEIVATGENKGGFVVEDEIIIGTTVGAEDRDFSGDLDDVRIYNVALPIPVIQGIIAEATSISTLIPVGLSDLSNVGFTADGFGVTLPEGATVDIEYSTDLVDWTDVANGVTGAYSDSDAARAANPTGFYRAKQ